MGYPKTLYVESKDYKGKTIYMPKRVCSKVEEDKVLNVAVSKPAQVKEIKEEVVEVPVDKEVFYTDEDGELISSNDLTREELEYIVEEGIKPLSSKEVAAIRKKKNKKK